MDYRIEAIFSPFKKLKMPQDSRELPEMIINNSNYFLQVSNQIN